MAQLRAWRAWGYPPSRPFALLTVYYVIVVLQLSAIAARPPLAGTHVTAIWALVGVTMMLAVAVGVAWSRWAVNALPGLVAAGILAGAVSAWVAVGGQGQLVAGFYLAVLGMFSGYFLSTRVVRVLTVLATVTYGAALISNWLLDSAAYVIAVVVLIDGVTLVVSSLVQHLRNEAVLDPLTGLLNRRGLAERAEALHAMDVRRNGPTTIVEIDLDGFKEFNDTRGHEAGDRLLTEVSRDWLGVVLILPATDRAEAEVLIERMRQANPFPWSAGLVEWQQGEQLPDALQHADALMYGEKYRGKGHPPQGRDLDSRP